MTNTNAPIIPRMKTTQTLISSRDLSERPYLAFPSLVHTPDGHVLVSFKRGWAHTGEGGADLDMFRFNPHTNEVSDHRTLVHVDNRVTQMGEWVTFANGDIANYIDMHITGIKKQSYRTGIEGRRSTDGGKTFEPIERFPIISGVEYGYPFESRTVGARTYLLVMAFEYMTGHKGSVDVVATDDNGKTWSFVQDLTHQFGNPRINESTFVPYEDGFLVSTRGYDNTQRIHRTDGDFQLRHQTDLTAQHEFIDRHVGRPRLFEKDGAYYLMGRNYLGTGDDEPMKMCLFRINPEDLRVESWSILDNHEEGRVIDGYYPVPFFHQRDGVEIFNVIDYKSVVTRYPGPDIIRFEYVWDEVK